MSEDRPKRPRVAKVLGEVFQRGHLVGAVVVVSDVEWRRLARFAPVIDQTDDGRKALLFLGCTRFLLTVFVVDEHAHDERSCR